MTCGICDNDWITTSVKYTHKIETFKSIGNKHNLKDEFYRRAKKCYNVHPNRDSHLQNMYSYVCIHSHGLSTVTTFIQKNSKIYEF